MTTLREAGEREAVRRLIEARAATAAGAVLGPGDDAAVLRPSEGCDLVATTDAFAEGRHYLPGLLDAAATGARLAAANLSDLAAMAARPRWAMLSIGARGDTALADLVALQRGADRALGAAGAALVGGNLVAVEGPEWASLALLGEASRGRAWTRSGARPGDALVVSGRPGRAAAGLRLARDPGALRDPAWQELVDAWARPAARVELALALAPLGAVRAAIDLSDGLAGDLARLCEASGVGAAIDEEPEDPLLARAAERLGVALDALRFGPSDDYELLLAVAPDRLAAAAEAARRTGVELSRWGSFTAADAGRTRRSAGGGRRPLEDLGFDHFA